MLVENVSSSAVRTTLQSLTQAFQYDLLGATSQIDYPVCVASFACGSASATGPIFTHKNGFLTAVATYAPGITYNPDGSLLEVKHNAAGTIKDTYTPDSSGMSRPGVISFAGMSSCSVTAAVSGGGTISGTQTAPIAVTFAAGTGPWHITWSDAHTDDVTSSPFTRNVSPPATTTYTITSVTGGSPACTGTSSGSALVTVQACDISANVASSGATITSGQSSPISATVTASGPWTVQWSDGQSQSGTNTATISRSVNPIITTTYTITTVTLTSSGCTGTSTGSATVNVNRTPTGLLATTSYGTNLAVLVQWNAVPGAGWYQVERATSFLLQDWQSLAHVSLPGVFDAQAAQSTKTYLYRVKSGVTINGVDYPSPASGIDYATVSTSLFTDELAVPNVTLVRGLYLAELRQAIDKVRDAAGLPHAWTSYQPLTGPILASYFTEARQKLDEASNVLVVHGIPYSGEVPTIGSRILASELQQLRDGVR